MHYETGGMTHQEIEEKEIIERYVLHQLGPEERLAFQEHYFSCDECFVRARTEARLIASVRQSSRSGALAADQIERPHSAGRATSALIRRERAGAWLMPALAASLLLGFALTGLWALSVRRENHQLTERVAEQSRASDRLRLLEEKVRELETNDSRSQQQRESLTEEIRRLKEEHAAAERQHEIELTQLRQPEINVPVRNIYPGGAQRSGRSGEINHVRVPRGTRAFVLILGDYKPGYPDYQLEVRDSSGRLVAKREGLKPDGTGDLSVMLNRRLLTKNKYTLKLYEGPQLLAEYVVLVE